MDQVCELTFVENTSRQERCLVCGNSSTDKHGIHFSAPQVCRACAAFFRRSVSYKREYTCVNDPVRCGVSDFYDILDRTVDEFRAFEQDSLLRQILVAQRATFVNRYAAQLQAYGGNHALVKMGKDNVIFANKVIIASEFIVLSEYLNGSGFSELGLSKLEVTQLAKDLFHTWLTFRATVTTLRNTQPQQNDICYFVDDSFVKVDQESLYNYVKSCPGLIDYGLAARYAFKCCSDKVGYAHRLRELQIEDLEQAVLFHLFALKTAQQLFSSNFNFKTALDKIFAELKNHFSTNGYGEVALRIGNITLMLGELGYWSKSLSEFVTVLTLNGYNSLFSSKESSSSPPDPKY